MIWKTQKDGCCCWAWPSRRPMLKGGAKQVVGVAALDVEPKVDLDTESPTAKESGANRGLETIGEKGAWDESVSFASRQRHVAVEKRKD